MFTKKSSRSYSNFVRPRSPSPQQEYAPPQGLTGEQAKKIYLEEISDIRKTSFAVNNNRPSPSPRKKRVRTSNRDRSEIPDKDLFVSVQNNELDTVRSALDINPNRINTLDDYGWSLLMIACQANSAETAKLLLERGIDTTVRDKAGHSAQSLVIRNKNLSLVNILIEHKSNHQPRIKQTKRTRKSEIEDEFECAICNNKYSNKSDHLCSTIHNINASKGKRIPTSYVIPQSNKGYQIMLKTGWDKECGLGKDGSGQKYPIKAVKKKDRKGLGNSKKEDKVTDSQDAKNKNKKERNIDSRNERNMEIRFRREFY